MSETAYTFLKDVFHDIPEGARPVVAGFVGDPKNKSESNWSAISVNGSWPKQLTEDHNLYFGISSISPDKNGNFSNKSSQAAALHVLMIDDVGTGDGAKTDGEGLLDPSYVVQTSPDNYQYFYLLDAPVTDTLFAQRLCNALARQAGGDESASNNVRWGRLPGGVNGKTTYRDSDGNPVATSLKEDESWLTYTAQEIIDAFGLDMDLIPEHKSDEFQAESFNYKSPMDLSDRKVIATLKYVDPDESYNDWLNTGIAIHHQYQGDYRGLEIWEEWSQRSQHYDLIELKEKWSSFGKNSFSDRILTFASIFQKAKKVRSSLLREREELEQREQAVSFSTGELPEYPVVAAIPPRDWIVQNRILKGFISAMVAPGGVSKSVFSMLTAASIATGNELTGEILFRGEARPARVLVVNNEDTIDELYRRINAISIFFNLDWGLLRDNFRVISGYGKNYRLMTVSDGKTVANKHLVDALTNKIKTESIEYLVIDPLVGFHDVSENDNGEMDNVAQVFRQIAAGTGCAIEIIHHSKKTGGDSESHAGDAEASRGATAVINAVRIAHTLARMSKKRAEGWNIPWEQGRRLVRLDSAKGNYSLPDEEAQWFELQSVVLQSGEEVGVPAPFDVSDIVMAAEKDKKVASEGELKQWRQAVFEESLKAGADKGVIRLSKIYPALMSRWGIKDRKTREQAALSFRFGKELAIAMESIDGRSYRVWYSSGSGRNSPTEVIFELILEVVK